MTIRHFLLAAALLLTTASVSADDERNRIGLSAMLASQDSYEIEFSYHYMASPMFGLGIALGGTSQFRAEHVPYGGMKWYIEDNSECVTNLYFRPSILLSTPLPKDRDFKFHFTAEPSLMLVIPTDRINIGYYSQGQRTHISASSGKKAWWGLKLGPNLTRDGLTMGVGYSISNYDIYALRRNVEFQGTKFARFYPEAKLRHGFYFTIGYLF